MRVLLTGSHGFVGRWLATELGAAGHSVAAAPSHRVVDPTDLRAMRAVVLEAQPQAVAHLGGVTFPPDFSADPGSGFQANVMATATLIEACRRLPGPTPVILVTGSSEVYRLAPDTRLPLAEDAEIAPRSAYGLSKLAQEAVAIEAAVVHGFPVLVARAFNHAGPGQRPEFVVPAIAHRVADVANGVATTVRVGNLDVLRDFTDVRDVVRAYRLLLEAAFAGHVGRPPAIVNVGSGRSVSIREVVERLAASCGIRPVFEVDPALVRQDDPAEIRADIHFIKELVGWAPRIPLPQTLEDVMAEARTALPTTSSRGRRPPPGRGR